MLHGSKCAMDYERSLSIYKPTSRSEMSSGMKWKQPTLFPKTTYRSRKYLSFLIYVRMLKPKVTKRSIGPFVVQHSFSETNA